MNLKHLTVVGLTALALVACGTPATQNPTAAPAAATTAATSGAGGATTGTTTAGSAATSADPTLVVARVGEITLTRGELDTRINRIQAALKASASAGQAPANLDIEKSLVDLFLNQILTLNVANDRSVAVTDAEIDKQIASISQSIQSQGGTIEQAITGQLGYENAQAPQFRQLISSIVARERIGETLVTTATVEPEVRATVAAQAKEEIQKANVRHILVATEAEATKVIERLNKGEKFEDLAKELSTDPGSKDNGGLYENVEPGKFVPEFDQAMFKDLQPGETTKLPVKTQFGYHVIRLDSRSTGPRYTAAEVEDQIKQQLPALIGQKRQEALQKLIDAAREKAKAAGQLIEPAYAEPTPVVPGELPTDIAPATTPAAGATATP